MAMKGLEMGLKVLFVLISVLAVVLIMLAIFSGGAQQLGGTLQTWIGGVPSQPRACSAYNGLPANCTVLAGCQCCDPPLCTKCISATERCV